MKLKRFKDLNQSSIEYSIENFNFLEEIKNKDIGLHYDPLTDTLNVVEFGHGRFSPCDGCGSIILSGHACPGDNKYTYYKISFVSKQSSRKELMIYLRDKFNYTLAEAKIAVDYPHEIKKEFLDEEEVELIKNDIIQIGVDNIEVFDYRALLK